MRVLYNVQVAALLLVLAALPQHPQSAAGGAALDEGTIMRRLRRLANQAGLVGRQEGKWTGWGLDDPAHHCSWHHVTCDASNHVTHIVWKTEGAVHGELQPLSNATTLLPEVAQLQHLARMELEIDAAVVGLPVEWGQPGAFLRLETLVLIAQAFTAANPLPAVQPGALPRLTELTIMLMVQLQPVPLPASWGSPTVWSTLRELSLTSPVALPLPATWAHGFPALQTLFLDSNIKPNLSRAAADAAAPDGPMHPPPAEWGRGFPKLQSLTLAYLGLNGTFPAAWQARGSFPELRELELGGNRMSGPLPADVLCSLPHLLYLELGNNQFTGGLPASWASCAGNLTDLGLQHNQLTGPAFPPAWLAPNSTLNLRRLQLSDNPGLEGTLPAALNWSNLAVMYVRGTGVDGRIPEQWCRARFARTVRQIDTDAVREPAFLDSLPTCVARDMPNLLHWFVEARQQIPELLSRDTSAALAGSGGTGRLLVLLALLVASAAAAAAVLRGRRSHTAFAWRPALLRRGQHRGDTAGGDEGIELLQSDPNGLDSSRVRQRRAPHLPELVPGRARLKALAQRQLGGTALLSGRPEAELLSVLRGTPAHNLAAPANGHTIGSAGFLGQPARGGVPLQLVRRWGLPTESLRIAAADVQFIAEPDGSLVQLGEGAHGVVYLAKLTDMYVAVKVFAVQPGMDSQAFWHEISLLARCVHPRIVPVYGVSVHGELVMVAMQLMLGGSLRVALADPQLQDQLRWNNCGRRVALDVADAVAYLHGEMRILHSDIKSANVLLDQDWRAALTDLGVAQVMEGTARTAAGGSRMYAAPEQLLGQRCTLAADIYSLGLLLTELTTRKAIVKRGHWELPRVPGDCPQDVADLIDQCLSSDPSQRPTAAEVLRRLRASGGDGG